MTKTYKLALSLVFVSLLSYGQFSESLLYKIRHATDDYYLANDTLKITGSKTLPCLDIMINGKGPYRFLIDLGSNVINFKKSLIEEAGLDLVVERLGRADLAVARSMQLGESTFLNVHGAVYEDLGEGIVGVLGFNLLGKSNFHMDYPKMEFAFIAVTENLNDSTLTPYELYGRMPYVKSTIANKEIYMNFDTGAVGWLYFPLTYKDSLSFKQPLKTWKKLWNNQKGTTDSYIGQVKESIKFGDFTIDEPWIVFEPGLDEVLIGSSMLQDFILTFYVDQKFVRLERLNDGRKIIIPYQN